MADRGYRIMYRGREPRDDDDRYGGSRMRVPGALDPYEYPEDRAQLKNAIAETKARNRRYHDDYHEYDSPSRRDAARDDVSLSASKAPGATRTTYSVTRAGLEKESEVAVRAPTAGGREPTASSRQKTFREDDELDLRRGAIRTSARPYDDRGYSRVEGAYSIESPRRDPGGAYVVDMRDADAIDVYTGSGAMEAGRGFGGYRNDPLDEPARDYGRGQPPRDMGYRQSESAYVERDDARISASSLRDGAYMSGARQDRAAPMVAASRTQTDFRGPSRISTRVLEDDRSVRGAGYASSIQMTRRDDEDFAFIEKTTARDRAPLIDESFREPFDGARSSGTPRGRGRAPSEADYVMVSPPQERDIAACGRQSVATGSTLRSAMFRGDSYTAEERLRRRRSRSCNFRDEDVDGHDCGVKFHEPPGAEAAMMGRYLNHYNFDEERDRMDRKSGSRNGSRRDLERYDDYKHDVVYDGRKEDRKEERYAPQHASSKGRGSSRRDDDDRSYVDTYREKTTKTTYI